ncbi:hypothetical protein DICPUDRAFT_79724 [Dictyostelium purpureum]|uniref:Uncharacterized protein n=1 Tax=Dictyostelium purpureum TaxID=5786 RepID=F0ZNF4_DICPU|nr:uncharacterized protein DICPUDRAFT_79724 [Dictyostelium purpureum]EGC34522.1 hypothetical protein DICPUDRAFT_79724 [Dictyostelium purpureum]|eukprot:XP_003288958.1 hypothetical protein DICPUDRAFT_79724 [Dictyostelium purpureum]
MRVLNLFSNQNKDLKNNILNDETIKNSKVPEEVIDAAVHYLVNGPIHANALVLRWDEDGIRERVKQSDSARVDHDTVKSSIKEFIEKNDNKGNKIHGSGDLYSFDSHRQLMDCLLHLKKRFNWICFSDHADNSPRYPVVHIYGLMKIDGGHVESSDMTDFNYF